MRAPALLIRADATPEIGWGHVMRCLALAEAWHDKPGGRVFFLGSIQPPDLMQRIRSRGFELSLMADDASPEESIGRIQQLALAQKSSGCVIALDGRTFSTEIQRAVFGRAGLLLVIDDNAANQPYACDVLLNQNIGAESMIYECPPGASILLGSSYALLRNEFLRSPKRSEVPTSSTRRLLVTMGGGEASRELAKALEAIRLLDRPGLRVIVVGQTPAYDWGDARVNFVQSRPMWELMEWADVALTAGGSTCWELAYMGIPAVVLSIGPDQIRGAEELGRRRVACYAGEIAHTDAERIAKELDDLISSASVREELRRNSLALIDGRGRERVIERMTKAAVWN